ncbi:MAG: hypothetical protein mread185_000684 [Mycoplasmataceae bacterium]|nr:MAG: hypothetical protein mread185_000684 [Mycoplasmataceae bacterium]
MSFFFITFAISLLSIGLTQIPSLATNKIGFGDIFHYYQKTAVDRLINQGLAIFAFAFFLHAILQSKAFEALFASKRKWLEKRKYLAIGLITIVAACLSSGLSWFDEFVHFYPLVIPLVMTMGFDAISSVICLYGGSIAGLMGLVSSERMMNYFGQCFGDDIKQGVSYNGMTGILFRLFGFLIFVSIVVLFNIWYCSRNKNKESELKQITQEEKQPPFNITRKIILALASFFLIFSIAAQIKKFSGVNKIFEKTPELLSSKYSETSYQKEGGVGEERKQVASENVKTKNYWDKFGSWEENTINCWLIIGAIIICLISSQNIITTLISAVQNSIPLLLVYIFSAVPAFILGDSGLSNKLAERLPEGVLASAKYWALIPIFGISALLTFFVSSPSIVASLILSLSHALFGVSSSVLIHAAIFSWTGAVLGMSFSPNSGILIASLERSKITYKQFIKKTWILWSMMAATAFGLVIFWTWFNVK